jgi:serine acetyltransferase
MGYDCIIYQNVTIGTKDTTNYLFANYPVIGDNVTIYPNAVIIGNISIGDNSIIGAGSIVNSDIPPNSIAYGNPAKIK